MMMFRLFFLLFLCSCATNVEKKTSDIFEDIDMDSIAVAKLEKDFVDGGLDGVNDAFYDLTDQMRKVLKENKSSTNLSESDQKKLITLVHTAEHITKKYDGGNMHYFGFSKLYLEIPGELTTAINKSNLKFNEKKDMIITLKNNVRLPK